MSDYKGELCSLGKQLILSGAAAETGLACLLESISENMDKKLEIFKEGGNDEITIEELLKANENIKDMICCLAKVEELILEKIKIGKELICMCKEEPCPPKPCPPIDDKTLEFSIILGILIIISALTCNCEECKDSRGTWVHC